MKLFFVLLLSLGASLAHAQSSANFAGTVEHIIRNRAQYKMEPANRAKISPTKTNQLYKLAQSEVSNWNETVVLPGLFFIAKEEVKIDSILSIKKNSELVAYEIFYSQKVWNLDGCDYDERALDNKKPNYPKIFKKCQAGRVHGVSFISADIKYVEKNWDEAEYFE